MQSIALELVGSHWQVFGAFKAETFFRALKLVLPDDARLYFEGTSISKDVSAFYSSRSVQPNIIVKRSTLFPKPSIFHLPFDQDVVESLCSLSLSHAEPELFDHFKAYTGNTVLLAMHEFAGDEPIVISESISEAKIKAFSDAIHGNYRKITM